jgi:hypothetical protein
MRDLVRKAYEDELEKGLIGAKLSFRQQRRRTKTSGLTEPHPINNILALVWRLHHLKIG